MNYLEIVQEASQRLGEDAALPTTVQGATGITANLASYVNVIYHQIEVSKKWWWLEKSARIRLFADYTTGTVTATAGSAVITGASTAWTTIQAGDLFQFSSDRDYFEVKSQDSATQLTLTSTATEAKTASKYTIIRPAYVLPGDYVRMKTVYYPELGRRVFPLDWQEFQSTRAQWFGTFRIADPRYYTVFGKDDTGKRLLWPYPYADDAKDLEITYIQEVAELANDTDEPLIPTRYQEVLVRGIMALYFRDIFDDIAQAQENEKAAGTILAQMLAEQDDHDAGDVHLTPDMSDFGKQLEQAVSTKWHEAWWMTHS